MEDLKKQMLEMQMEIDILKETIHVFTKNRYGYRRIHALLKREDMIVSEKIVRRIMHEEKLVVKVKRTLNIIHMQAK